jgi:hypothetical protein
VFIVRVFADHTLHTFTRLKLYSSRGFYYLCVTEHGTCFIVLFDLFIFVTCYCCWNPHRQGPGRRQGRSVLQRRLQPGDAQDGGHTERGVRCRYGHWLRCPLCRLFLPPELRVSDSIDVRYIQLFICTRRTVLTVKHASYWIHLYVFVGDVYAAVPLTRCDPTDVCTQL